MKFLKVHADGTLMVPSLEKLAEAMGSTTESLRLHEADVILQEARQMKASLQPLREVSTGQWKSLLQTSSKQRLANLPSSTRLAVASALSPREARRSPQLQST
jgi:hypothetical protein